jgi:predicted Zn-dependent peptidase
MADRPKFKKTVLENGLTLLTEQLSGFRSLSIGVWVKAGTRHEPKTMAGVSHYLEHMLFKGTKKRTALQIAQEVDQVGGEFNAFTAREHTCFHILLLDRDCSLGLDILSDVLMNSLFKKDEIERERKVILQEIAMVEESPEELAYDLYFEQIYSKHSLGRPILGTQNSVKKMKREDLIQYFAHNYRPDQLVVSVAGQVSHEAVKKKLKSLTHTGWRKAPGKPNPLLHTSSLAPPTIRDGFWWVERPTEQVHLIWGVEGPHYSSRDRFAAFLLNVYLGGGMSSSLFQEIREKNGLAYTVYSTLSPFVDSGVFTVYVGTGLVQVPMCLRLIEECVQKMKKKPLSKRELKVIQDNLKGTILLSSDCVESRMSSIAKNEIFLGRYVSVEEVCKMIDEVTPADVQRVAQDLFREDKRSILALGPKPTPSLLAKLPPWVPLKY